MVGSQHEAMHRIFQHDPKMFARAFRALDVPLDDPTEVVLLPTDLTEVRPLERRVDTLLRFTTATGQFLLLVEAQGEDDPAKPSAWAYYLAHAHAKYRLPALLLVVCHDQATALWAARPVAFGQPFWSSLTMRPLVLGPENVRPVTDPDEAAADIALTALSAMTHAKDPCIGEILKALAAALRGIDEEDAHVIAELTELGLGKSPAAHTWRHLMSIDPSFFRSETSQRLREEGRTEGLIEGEAKGEAKGVAGSILEILAERSIEVPPDARARITSCKDRDVLRLWLRRSATVTSIADLFGAE
ncbi:hypothetical protein NONI108955_44845 [Nocardia ninae]|uniref:Transposase (putative) YhgA-like domain-containing protein n=1 Tax=Nocardia ninae NBRC 108245 TaxID=1210091 RepID=A0A511MAZ4_9NOCA|nr:hypothetical protein [Nocardia ninae]GEM37769.1 hypothetical protein NN4_22880 [Nocardia ninae NBRC 108245]